ncbi:MAG: ABC transporter substrate-binding protein [Coriobacteriales bacterium]|jgi:NitT/TauT family transport system substrate-binding protein
MKKGIRKWALPMIMALVLAAFLGLAGCSSSGTDDSAADASGEATEAAGMVDALGVDHTPLDISKVGTDDYTIRLNMTKNNPNPVAVINAYQEGYFAEEGCNVDLQIVEDMGTAYSSVATDKADMVVAMNLALNRIAEGEQNLYMAGGIMSEGGACFVKADSDITLEKPEDFKGLTICGIQAHSELVVIEAWLLNNGLERGTDYDVIYSEDMAVNIENVQNGTADVAILNGVPVYMIGVKSGCKVAALNEDLVGKYPCCRVTVNKAMVTEHQYALAQFLVAELRGYELYKNDKEATVKNLADFTGVDEESLEAVYYGTDDFRTPMEIIMDPQVDYIKSYYKDYQTDGFIAEDAPAPDDFFYNESYVAALETLAQREPDNALWKELQDQYKEYNTTYPYNQ